MPCEGEESRRVSLVVVTLERDLFASRPLRLDAPGTRKAERRERATHMRYSLRSLVGLAPSLVYSTTMSRSRGLRALGATLIVPSIDSPSCSVTMSPR